MVRNPRSLREHAWLSKGRQPGVSLRTIKEIPVNTTQSGRYSLNRRDSLSGWKSADKYDHAISNLRRECGKVHSEQEIRKTRV